MDAVSFVMGVNTKDLRGAKVADFRSHSAKPGDPNTSVTMFYRSTSQRFHTEAHHIMTVPALFSLNVLRGACVRLSGPCDQMTENVLGAPLLYF